MKIYMVSLLHRATITNRITNTASSDCGDEILASSLAGSIVNQKHEFKQRVQKIKLEALEYWDSAYLRQCKSYQWRYKSGSVIRIATKI